jgi:hypothetical protein
MLQKQSRIKLDLRLQLEAKLLRGLISALKMERDPNQMPNNTFYILPLNPSSEIPCQWREEDEGNAG